MEIKTIPNQHPYCINEWREFFLPLQKRILDLDDPVCETVTKYYVVYKKKSTGIGFARIYGRGGEQGYFQLMFQVNPWEINDPWNVCSEVSDEEAHNYRRPNWKTRIDIATVGQRKWKYIYNEFVYNRVENLDPPLRSLLDYLMQLIRQL